MPDPQNIFGLGFGVFGVFFPSLFLLFLFFCVCVCMCVCLGLDVCASILKIFPYLEIAP